MSESRFRILVLADSRAFHTERYVAELRRQGCRVMVASLEHGPMHHHHLRPVGSVRWLHYWLACRQVRHVVERFRPDVVNPHFATGYGWLAARACRGVPIALNLWGSDILLVPRKSPLHRIKAVQALRKASAVFGDSQHLLDEAARIHAPSPTQHRRLIPWGIERRFLDLHKRDYRLSRPLRVLIPRTQAAVYNNEFLLTALGPFLFRGHLVATFPNWGPLALRFRRLVENMPEGSIHLYDRLPRDTFLRLAAQHDVCLSAARSDSSPASVIEAMALGLLPIAADIRGVREWLSPDSGFLFEQDSVTSLRDVISSLLGSADPRTEMRHANLDRVRREAVFEDNVAEQLALMRRVAEGGRRS